MKHWFIALWALLCTACHDEIELPQAPLRHVAIVYVIGENSLSYYAQDDLSEMRRGMGNIPDSCQLVVYFDNSNGEMPKIMTFDSKRGERLLHEYKEDLVSTDSATLQQVLDFIIQKCPAREYGLTMWSHGSGWIPEQPRMTIGIDNRANTTSNTGPEMEISTLTNILRQTGVEWNYVFFDACFMQGVEVAYELRDAVAWCIGSPAEIPGNGAPYDYIMADLFAEREEAWTIARDYFEYYRNSDGLVVSAVRTSELEALAEATRPYIAGSSTLPTEGVQKYLPVLSSKQWKPEYFDMGSAMGQWLYDDEYPEWRQALDRAVPYRYFTRQWMSQYAGRGGFWPVITDDESYIACLSMYIPVEGRALNDYFARTSWYKAAGWH